MSESLSGKNIDGYIIGPLIGGGGMGEVYQVYPENELSNPLAMKVLKGAYAQDSEFQARFVREVRLMEALKHDNIVPIHGYGFSNDYLYFVMKLVNGSTLAYLLTRHKFSPRAAWNILKPIAKGLEFGHEQGILHRDIKPGNVLVERQKEGFSVFLTDYGLGKKPGTDETLTADGVSIGTPEYMAPESVLGERIDHQADVYSLAVMSYEVLLGVLPFDTGQAHLTALAHVNDPPPPPREKVADFPTAIEAVLLKGLAKTREARYQSVREFAEGLYKAVSGLSSEDQQKVYWVT